jgi:hypothetical protein
MGEHRSKLGVEPLDKNVPPSAGEEIETAGGMTCLEH